VAAVRLHRVRVDPAALAAALWLRRRRAEPATTGIPPIVRYLWWLSLPLVLLAAWILGLAVYGPFTPEWTVRHLAYRALPPACALWGTATLVLCAVITVRRVARRDALRVTAVM
jgi:hypothetical protein